MNEFDEKAQTWDAKPIRVERAQAVAKGIMASVTLDVRMRALEYGCGTGLLSFALQSQLGHITLADSSPGMLEAFYALLDRRGTLCVADLDAEDGSFHEEPFDGHRGFDRDALGALAEASGFQNVRFSTVFHMIKDVQGVSAQVVRKDFPIFLMVAEKH